MKSLFRVLKSILSRVIFSIGLVTVIVGVVASIYFAMNPDRMKAHFQKWRMEEEAVTSTVSLPRESGEVTLTVVPLHPFLSEYKYIVRVRTKNGRRFKETLEIQSGGPPDVMVLWFESTKRRQYLCFDHHVGAREIFEVLELSEGSFSQFPSLSEVREKCCLSKATQIVNLGWITEKNLKLIN